jgi:hypothetical protein
MMTAQSSLRDRLDPRLAREFLAKPVGPHSAALQDLLVRMRQPGVGPDWIIVAIEPWRRYVVAHRVPEGRPHLLLDQEFASVEDCERAVFCARWVAAGGAAEDVA